MTPDTSALLRSASLRNRQFEHFGFHKKRSFDISFSSYIYFIYVDIFKPTISYLKNVYYLSFFYIIHAIVYFMEMCRLKLRSVQLVTSVTNFHNLHYHSPPIPSHGQITYTNYMLRTFNSDLLNDNISICINFIVFF